MDEKGQVHFRQPLKVVPIDPVSPELSVERYGPSIVRGHTVTLYETTQQNIEHVQHHQPLILQVRFN